MASIMRRLVPFTVPDFVTIEAEIGTRQEGINFSNNVKITEVDESALIEMCEDFKYSLLVKAGYQ